MDMNLGWWKTMKRQIGILNYIESCLINKRALRRCTELSNLDKKSCTELDSSQIATKIEFIIIEYVK